MATTPNFQEPQIAAARAQAWHQTGEALLTLEAARAWLNEYGLIFFAPRAGSLGAPAPSLVEATLGTAKSSISLAETETARTLTARLVGEGSALPLNLLGGPGDLPDFVVSAQAFPFVFTLRGDKGWKRPPETSGAVKVTPLGLRVYELLTEKGALTIADIVSEVGREVTESAVARALSELWQLLRVIPVLQQGEGDTIWELTTTRFMKAVKAGANAGQPTALSALASLYLSQAYIATEEEIAGFLSPLTARSRVREVVHGLVAGRQVTEAVVNGKTVLYIPDSLPDFAEFAKPEPETAEDETAGTEGQETAEGGDEASTADAPRERIRRFDGESGRPQDRNLRGKPVRREGAREPGRGGAERPRREGTGGGFGAGRGAPRSGAGERRSFGAGGDRPPRREEGAERPARRDAGDRPSFTRPWDEERSSRPPRREFGDRPARAPRGEGEQGGDRPPRPRPSREGGEDRPFRPRPSREGGEDRPFRPRSAGDRPFRARPEGSGDRPAFRRRDDASGERPSRPRREGTDRPFRPRAEGEDRPFRPRTESGDRPYRARPEGGDRPFRPRPAGDRPFRARPEGGDRPFRARPEGGDRPFRPRTEGGDRPYRPRPEGGDRPFRPREGGAREGGARDRRGPGGPPAGRFGGGSDRPSRPRAGAERGGEGERRPPRPSFGGRSGEGRPPRGEGAGPSRFGDRRGPRAGGAGGFRPAAKRAGAKGAGRPDRPARPPRPRRPEDEA